MAKGGTPEPKLSAGFEAEAALIGILLWDGADERPIVLGLLPGELGAAHFYEPFHGRVFERWKRAMAAGQRFDMVLAADAFAHDPAFQELGPAYFAKLFESAPPREGAADYARAIIDGGTRRRLVSLAKDIQEAVQDLDTPAEQVVGEVAAAVSDISSSTSGMDLIDADTAMDRVLDYIDNPSAHPDGILTGLAPIDKTLGPWLPGDLLSLAARPGAGKSAVAAIVSRNVAKPLDGRPAKGVIEFHGEMSVEQVTRRRLTATAYEMAADQAPTYSAIRKRQVEMAQRDALGAAREYLRGIPIRAVSRAGLTLTRMRAMVERQRLMWERQGIELGLVIIDHAGLIKPDREYRTRVDEQTAVSGGLKAMASDLKVPFLALLQLSRAVEGREDKHPMLSDLRDSGSWEQDTDVVMSAYRDAYYAQKETEPDDSTPKGAAAWAEWDARRRSPWIDIDFLKVREGSGSRAKLWADMGTNAILGAAPEDDHFRGLI